MCQSDVSAAAWQTSFTRRSMSHQCVNFFLYQQGTNYPIELLLMVKQAYQPKGWLTVNDAENYVICALRGGLVQLPRYHVADALEEGRLVEVLSEWQSPGMSLRHSIHSTGACRPECRVFIDWSRSSTRTFPEEKQ